MLLVSFPSFGDWELETNYSPGQEIVETHSEYKDWYYLEDNSRAKHFYNNIIFETDKEIRDQNIQLASQVLDFEEAIAIASNFGKIMAANYDNERTDLGSSKSKGVVDFDEIVAAINNPNLDAGVCRDIHYAMGEFLGKMGVKCYNISFAMNSDLHTTLACIDSQNPERIIKFNYGIVTVNDKNTGSFKFTQNTNQPATGINYKINDQNGKAIADIKTPLGEVLSFVTDQDPKWVDPTKSHHDVKIIRAIYSFESGVRAGLYKGRTSTNEDVQGLFVSHTFNLNTTIGILRADIATSIMEYYSQGEFVGTDGRLIYGRSLLSFESEDLISNDNFELRLHTDLNTEFALIYNKDSSGKSGNTVDGLAQYSVGFDGKITASKDFIPYMSYRSNGTLGLDDVRNIDTLGLHETYQLYTVGADYKITKDYRGNSSFSVIDREGFRSQSLMKQKFYESNSLGSDSALYVKYFESISKTIPSEGYDFTPSNEFAIGGNSSFNISIDSELKYDFGIKVNNYDTDGAIYFNIKYKHK